MTHRNQSRDAASEEAGRVSPDPLSPQTPFERFEEFARKVISVPKTEIEERERAYRERRQREKEA